MIPQKSSEPDSKILNPIPASPIELKAIDQKPGLASQQVGIVQALAEKANSEGSVESNWTPKEKSGSFTMFLVFLVASGTYFLGYFLAITNVMSEALLIGVYGLDEDTFQTYSGYLGFMFSIGCFVGLICEGWLTVKVGRIRLIYVLEVLNIIHALLYRIQILKVLLFLRLSTGLIAGISTAFIPVLCHDMFPADKASYGGTFAYFFLVAFIVLAYFQDMIFGGLEGLRTHAATVLSLPVYFGILRLIFMSLYLVKLESPHYWIEVFTGSEDALRENLNSYHQLLYEKEDAIEMTERRIDEKHDAEEEHDEGSGLSQMMTTKYRKRFILGVLLYQFQILGGINILGFFSTQIFNRISGNGAQMTLLIGFANLAGAIISLYTQKFKRIMVYNYSLIAHALGIVGVAIGVWSQSGTLAAVFMVIYIIGYSIGNGSMMMVYLSEILPPAGIGAASASQWVTSALQGLIVAPMIKLIGIGSVFLLCALFIIIHIYLLNKLGVETLGKSEEQIEADFLGTKAKRRSHSHHSRSHYSEGNHPQNHPKPGAKEIGNQYTNIAK